MHEKCRCKKRWHVETDLRRGVNRSWAPAFGPRGWQARELRLVPRVGEQLEDGLSNPWRDVHDNVLAAKLAWMRQAARVSDHLEVPLESKRAVAHSHALVRGIQP